MQKWCAKQIPHIAAKKGKITRTYRILPLSQTTADSTEGKWIVENRPTHTSFTRLAAAFSVRVAHASSCALSVP